MTHACFISLLILGIYVTTWPGMIFYKPANFFYKTLVRFIHFLGIEWTKAHDVAEIVCKPFFRCLICMSSVWTTVIWLLDDHSFMLLPMILVVAGLNTLIVSLIKDIIPYECD